MKIEVKYHYVWNDRVNVSNGERNVEGVFVYETKAENLFPEDVELMAQGMLDDSSRWNDDDCIWIWADIFVDGEFFSSII